MICIPLHCIYTIAELVVCDLPCNWVVLHALQVLRIELDIVECTTCCFHCVSVCFIECKHLWVYVWDQKKRVKKKTKKKKRKEKCELKNYSEWLQDCLTITLLAYLLDWLHFANSSFFSYSKHSSNRFLLIESSWLLILFAYSTCPLHTLCFC